MPSNNNTITDLARRIRHALQEEYPIYVRDESTALHRISGFNVHDNFIACYISESEDNWRLAHIREDGFPSFISVEVGSANWTRLRLACEANESLETTEAEMEAFVGSLFKAVC